MLHNRAQGCTTVAHQPYLIILALCSTHPPVRKKFVSAQNGARAAPGGGGGQGAQGQANRALTSSFRSLHIPAYLTDPYRPLRIIAYPCILLHTLTDPYKQCISLHILAYPYIPLQASGLGPWPGPGRGWPGGGGARTILGTNEYIRGVCRAKCQYDKIGLMGYCSATLGPIVQHLKCIVGSPQAPAPVQALGRELT